MEKELEFNLGIVRDPRTPEEKAMDYKHKDIIPGLIVAWKEKPLVECKEYIPRYQDGSLSCVGQSCAKAMEIMGFGVESAHPIYRNRANYPDGGMWLGDAGLICFKIGTTKEVLDPSQNLSETPMNLPCEVIKTDRIGGYAFPNPKEIDQIAESIILHGHCILTFHANGNEWTSEPKYNGMAINFGHAIVAVDFFIYKGQKCILIEDSARNDNTLDKKQRRIISEDYLKARCSGAIYFAPKIETPPYIFTKFLKIGSVGTEVKMLQIKLGIGADGLFGIKTKAAVIKYQLAHNLVGDGIVGPLTIKALNK